MQRTMRCAILAWAASSLVAAGPATAEITTYFGFHIGVTNAPPPPRVAFREAPPLVSMGGSVYVVVDPADDYDLFRCGSYWYVTRGGYWYRARSHRGPFVAVDARKVPRAIFAVPAAHWKHHPHGGPPGLTKKHGHGRKRGKG